MLSIGDFKMKNKAIHDLTKQHHHDLRVNEENIRRLANDITRLEAMLDKLWGAVYHNEPIAATPKLQELKCDSCGEWSRNYRIETVAEGYVKLAICKSCIEKREFDDGREN